MGGGCFDCWMSEEFERTPFRKTSETRTTGLFDSTHHEKSHNIFFIIFSRKKSKRNVMFYQFPYDNHYYRSRGDYMTPREYELYRKQKAYEQLRRRQIAEERQRQEYLLRRQRAEEARLERERYERQIDAQRAAPLRKSYDSKEENDEREYRVVRGWDGRLYRVRVQENDDEEYRWMRDWDGSITRVQPKLSVKDETRRKDRREEPAEEDRPQLRAVENSAKGSQSNLKSPLSTALGQKESYSNESTRQTAKNDKRKKKKITVIVEDVSDSSDAEEDEMNSYWRNRHPSPNESWMEPIEQI